MNRYILVLLVSLISLSALGKEAIYRKIGDLMYIPKKGEFTNETSIYFSTGETERFYRNLPSGISNDLSEYTNDVERSGVKNKISYGFNKNFNINLEFGFETQALSNTRIPSLYFNNMPFNQEVQFDEENSGMTDPTLGFSYRFMRQAKSKFTMDLMTNISLSLGDAERSEGYFRGGLGATSVSITEYANNAANANAGFVQDGNVSSGASKIEIGTRLGKKFSPRLDAMGFALLGYHLEREVSHLNGDLTTGIANSKTETIDAIADLTIGALVQYRLQPVTFYGGAHLKYIPSYNINTKYEASLINEIEEFDAHLRYGLTLGGKWIIIDRRLLLDLSVDMQLQGTQESTLRVTAPSNPTNTAGAQYEYSAPLNITPQLKLHLFF